MDMPSNAPAGHGPVDLDAAATTPLDDGVRAVMEAALVRSQGNPSSRHGPGVAARRELDAARGLVARCLDAQLESVLFTSGGTEANNLGVLGLARAQGKHGRHVLVGCAEHPSVAAPAAALARGGFEVQEIPMLRDGTVDLEGYGELLREDTVLVAQMLVNNLLGSIAEVRAMARLARARCPRMRFHVDAVQAIGKVAVSFRELGVHSLSLSAHKLHGPKGAGALLVDPKVRLEPLFFGGGQERGLRPGTENAAAAAGLAQAVERATRQREEHERHLWEVRGILCAAVDRIAGTRIFEAESRDQQVPSILAVGLPGPPAEVWMHHLEEAGVLSSVGSACQARTKSLPQAFAALGLGAEEARRVLRLSAAGDFALEEAHLAGKRLRGVAARLTDLGLLSASSAGREHQARP